MLSAVVVDLCLDGSQFGLPPRAIRITLEWRA